ncbi:hypothetical protein SCB71_06295 [Herbiconiux sp. KACC 21604]|uniref:hypothetical protein n=1 Tax=unclassified Herbiconiux TaxID=2618217 RepID=UPI0014911BE0|nr:hypothetical protein [Herbiconiux sp. SALV-R1]QJU52928.1 hypothetical protein HL652_04280 [Herbiconiux sp. SALV-R1]WPO87848.1 hypothetical protein SCB71_06295 [Herbiconiux sp. KACC 21604]
MRESGSHLHADLAKLRFAGSHADRAGIQLAEWYINVHLDRKRHKKDIELPGPWGKANPNADVTPERRAALRAELERRSAFAH